jgi:hypothetical protein
MSMSLLAVLTIVLGLVIAGSRSACLVSPPLSRRMMQGFLDRPVFVLILGLIASLYGIALFYVTRIAVWDSKEISFAAGSPALIVGLVMCALGLAILFKPAIFTNRISYMLAKSDSFLRKIMAIGFVAGLLIIALGIFLY